MQRRAVILWLAGAFVFGSCVGAADPDTIAGAIEQEKQARKTRDVRAPPLPDLERSGSAGVVVLSNNVGWQRALGIPNVRGAVVLVVVPGSPAERAGLQRGDIITKVGSTAITNHERVRVALRAKPGLPLKLSVTRREEQLTMELIPAPSFSVDFPRLYDDLLASDPGNPVTMFLRAQASTDSKESLQFLNRALEIQPDLVDALSYRARLFWLESVAVQNEAVVIEDRSRATADFERALDVDPDATVALIDRGSSMLEVLRYDDAERDALRVIGIDATLPSASLLLAAARYGAGRAREAAAPAREAVRLDPYDYRNYRVLALVFVALGRREDAGTAVRAGLTVAPNDSAREELRAVLEQ